MTDEEDERPYCIVDGVRYEWAGADGKSTSWIVDASGCRLHPDWRRVTEKEGTESE